MSELLNDWRPETQSLLERLQKAGFEIVSGQNGEGESLKFKNVPQMVKHLISCDDASLIVKHAEYPRQICLVLIYGNEPGYLVSDYSVPSDKSVSDLLNATIEAHGNEWERKGQAKATAEEIYA